ncbi:uncharacterized protein K489DRAFT_383259 [Dissoconium aciculare CBS 342.82]|uniref:Uncharacterized protein n=1 Tax=Dissoconium aciculare CBS 342.82 TaxID=1314786 RepID=A0A6J3LWM8_9PEZI|nr:uncharacterized protein K489DRAFT_383259 [Dissoconium aciculare CBS 342.82]KAF1819694.1 hypothetical protein K489DRAFT_383259 [Dissoconium aciculare CBS 342.82]
MPVIQHWTLSSITFCNTCVNALQHIWDIDRATIHSSAAPISNWVHLADAVVGSVRVRNPTSPVDRFVRAQYGSVRTLASLHRSLRGNFTAVLGFISIRPRSHDPERCRRRRSNIVFESQLLSHAGGRELPKNHAMRLRNLANHTDPH